MKIKVRYTARCLMLCVVWLIGLGQASIHAQFSIDDVTLDTLSIEKMSLFPHGYYLDAKWLMRFGDQNEWKNPEYDALGWHIHPSIFEASELEHWKGIAWFRKKLHVDENLRDQPLFMALATNSAVELYINGELFTGAGKVGATAKEEAFLRSDTLRYLPLKAGETYLFSARVSNHQVPSFLGGLLPGFRLVFDVVHRVPGDYFTHPSNKMSVDRRRVHNVSLIVVSVLSLSVFFIHILMYVFYRDRLDNLYYALAMLLHIAALMANYYVLNGENPFGVEWAMWWNSGFYLLMGLFMTLYFYEVCHVNKGAFFWSICGTLVLLTLSSLIVMEPVIMVILTTIYLGLIIVDAFRVFIIGIRYRNKMMHFLLWPSVVSITYFILRNVVALFASREVVLMYNSIIEYGMVPLILGMSFYLAFDLADTSIKLKAKLDENKKLAARSLEEEKRNAALKIEKEREASRAKVAELQTEMLQKENERKSKELEEARQLQISLLPDCPPFVHKWDICFQMSTSSEVGGDYYDYILQSDEELILGIGDATGHGLKAGSVVTAVKALFQVLGDKSTPDQVLLAMSEQLRHFGFRRTFMTFTLARFDKNTITFSNAGMPYPLHYKADEQAITELTLRGMPLGSPARYEYQLREAKVDSGDILVFYSDGLSETFNEQRDMLDTERIKEVVLEQSGKSATQISRALMDLVQTWRGTAAQHDDITLIVMKYGE